MQGGCLLALRSSYHPLLLQLHEFLFSRRQALLVQPPVLGSHWAAGRLNVVLHLV